VKLKEYMVIKTKFLNRKKVRNMKNLGKRKGFVWRIKIRRTNMKNG
jgi:hypothetical protein